MRTVCRVNTAHSARWRHHDVPSVGVEMEAGRWKRISTGRTGYGTEDAGAASEGVFHGRAPGKGERGLICTDTHALGITSAGSSSHCACYARSGGARQAASG
jgi:hypothetical protein